MQSELHRKADNGKGMWSGSAQSEAELLIFTELQILP